MMFAFMMKTPIVAQFCKLFMTASQKIMAITKKKWRQLYMITVEDD